MPRNTTTATMRVGDGPEIDASALFNTTDLQRYVDRLVTLHEEKQEVAEQIRQVVTDAKNAGYHTQALREMVKRRVETPEQRDARISKAEAFALMEAALGEFGKTALGSAALAAAQ